jgi:hypothetical protein
MKVTTAPFILLILPLLLFSQNKTSFANKSINNYELIEILNNAKSINLNDLTTEFDKSLSIKLYSVGINEPAYGTEMIVAHKYYLAVSEYDEYPDQAVFYLGRFGEISEIIWADTERYDTALLQLKITEHPSWVLKIDPKLNNKKASYSLLVTVNKLELKN